MAVVASVGGNNNPVAGLPTPVLLALVGGGIGAVILIRRKMGGGPSSGTPSDQQTLLPNTAIMLGSLQQDLLQLKGDVGANQAESNMNFQNLSGTVTGVGENIGSQLDAMTSQEQQAFTDLQNNLTNHFDTNTSTILDSMKSQGDVLANLIGQNTDAENAFASSLSDSISKGLDSLTAQHNAELAGLQTLGGNIGTLGSAIGTVQNQIASMTPVAQTNQTPSMFGQINVAPYKYVWYQPPGANQYQASVFKVAGGQPQAISWNQYTSETGSQTFDFTSPNNLVIRSG